MTANDIGATTQLIYILHTAANNLRQVNEQTETAAVTHTLKPRCAALTSEACSETQDASHTPAGHLFTLHTSKSM